MPSTGADADPSGSPPPSQASRQQQCMPTSQTHTRCWPCSRCSWWWRVCSCSLRPSPAQAAARRRQQHHPPRQYFAAARLPPPIEEYSLRQYTHSVSAGAASPGTTASLCDGRHGAGQVRQCRDRWRAGSGCRARQQKQPWRPGAAGRGVQALWLLQRGLAGAAWPAAPAAALLPEARWCQRKSRREPRARMAVPLAVPLCCPSRRGRRRASCWGACGGGCRGAASQHWVCVAGPCQGIRPPAPPWQVLP